jgi:hypothetical protein
LSAAWKSRAGAGHDGSLPISVSPDRWGRVGNPARRNIQQSPPTLRSRWAFLLRGGKDELRNTSDNLLEPFVFLLGYICRKERRAKGRQAQFCAVVSVCNRNVLHLVLWRVLRITIKKAAPPPPPGCCVPPVVRCRGRFIFGGEGGVDGDN